jgi:hypothetical protein
MGNPRPGHVKEFPLMICQACGGDWFRAASFYEFGREELVRFWPTPDLVGQISPAPMTIGVCLCGRPWSPSIGDVRGGYTPNAELNKFMSSLKQAQDPHGGQAALQVLTAGLAPQQAFQILTDRLKALERQHGRRLRSPGPGRYWEPPRRKPASKGLFGNRTSALPAGGEVSADGLRPRVVYGYVTL